MAIGAVIWRDNEQQYKVQINGVPARSRRAVMKEFKEWRSVGEGWDHRNKKAILLFTKEFEDRDEIMQWAQALPYPVTEISSRGNAKQLTKSRKNS